MTEQTFERIDGIDGVCAVRVMDYDGQPCLEVEPQEERYWAGGSPRVVRIMLDDESPEEVLRAKMIAPDCLEEMLAA